MSKLALFLGVSLMVAGCSTGPASTPTSTLAEVAPTFAPPISTPGATPAQAATDAPSAPPASPGNVGDRIEVSGYQYLTLAEAEYSTDGYSEFFAPEEGNVIYAFLFEFEGLDPEGSSYNPLYFDLTVDGVRFSTAILGGKEPSLDSGELQPGATASGWISFNAPLADQVILKYEPVMGLAGNAVEWNVEVLP